MADLNHRKGIVNFLPISDDANDTYILEVSTVCETPEYLK